MSTSRNVSSESTKLAETVAANFPPELLQRQQWVCWRSETRNGRPTKVPYSPVSGRHALSTVAATWGSFEQAAAVATAGNLLGIGYVFSADDPYCGVDFDHCVNPTEGDIEPWARDWVDRLKSYTELSPSGSGLHVFVRGQLAGSGRKKGGIEIYDRGRFFTVTGRALAGTSRNVEQPGTELEQLYQSLASKASGVLKDRLELRRSVGPELPDSTVIESIVSSSRRTLFQQLWAGNWQARFGSQSEADLALTGLLAEFVGNNPIQIDRLFRKSGLFREKWDEQRGVLTYGEKTMAITLQQGQI